MPRYNVLITRDCTESVELMIEADTPEAAIAAAEKEARDSLDLHWVPDDCSNHGDPYFAGEPSELVVIGKDAAA